jgi:hypothetical protein
MTVLLALRLLAPALLLACPVQAVDTNLWGITGTGAKSPLTLASINAASGALKPGTGAQPIDCGTVVQQGSALDPVKRVFYNVALNCTDPESGTRNPKHAGVYWLVGVALATGQVVTQTKLPLLLPYNPIVAFDPPGEGITVAADPVTGDVLVFGPSQIVKLPPGAGAQEGPLMLLQRLVAGPDDSLDMAAINVSSVMSASTIVGVDATYGDGVFYSFITPVNTTGIHLVSVDATQQNAIFKDIGETAIGTADYDRVSKRVFGLAEDDGKRTLLSVDTSTGESKKVAELTGFNVEWGSDATLDPTLRIHYSLLCPSAPGGGGCASSDFHLVQINIDDGGFAAHPTECATPDECTLSMEAELLPAQ